MTRRSARGSGRGLCALVVGCTLFLGASTVTHAQMSAGDRGPDAWFGPDKALHFGATFALAGAGYGAGAALSREPVARFGLGASLAMGAGIAKEMIDRRTGGNSSLRDLTWDAVGTAAGLLVSWLVDRYVF